MICNIDGSWTLEPQDIRGLNLAVAKVLQERAESSTKTFNADKFVKYMYDQILDRTGDAQKALAFARFVPEAMLTLSVTKPDIRRALTGKGFDMGQVTQLADRFSNSLNDVSNFLVEQVGTNKGAVIQAGLAAGQAAARMQPEPKGAQQTGSIAKEKDDFDLPYNPLATTGNELKRRKRVVL